MNALERFQDAARHAVEAERADPYGWNLVRHGAAIVATCRAHPESRPDFEKELVALIDAGNPGGPFVEFCMHALRWDNVRTAIEQRHSAAVARNDWRAEPYFRHLLASFEDGWDDANDIYADYFRASSS